MLIDKSIAKLICNLENEIANNTYNPNSYNGFTGEEGCEFRYPVNYCKTIEDLENKKLTKQKCRITDIEPDCLKTIKYMFSSNHLYIGDGLINVLEYLEKEYEINFNDLEKKRLQRKHIQLEEIKSALDSGKEFLVNFDEAEVGFDFPIGVYEIFFSEPTHSGEFLYINDSNGIQFCVIWGHRDNHYIVSLAEGDVISVYGNNCPIIIRKTSRPTSALFQYLRSERILDS